MKLLKKAYSYHEVNSSGIVHCLRGDRGKVFIEVYEWAPGQYTLEWDDRKVGKSVGILSEYFRMMFDYLQDAVVAASRLYYYLRNAPDEEWWLNRSCGYSYYTVGAPCRYVREEYGDWSKRCQNPFNFQL